MWQATDFPVFQKAGYLAEDAGLTGITDRNLWADITTYAVNDAVICRGNAWVCIAPHTSDAASQPGVGSSSATYWQVVNQPRLWQDLQLAFTISTAAAQRLAKIYLMRNRQQGTGTVVCKLTALRTHAMDVIQWTHPNMAFTDKLCEVSNWRLQLKGGASGSKAGDGEVPVLTVELDLQETGPEVYAWSPDEEQILYAPNATIPLGAQ